MKKFLITLILLALSIQTSFAVVSSYCHEEQVATHLAHHEHADEVAKDISTAGSNGSDIDCEVCHLAHSPCLSKSFSFTSIPTTRGDYFNSAPVLSVGTVPPPPEKPNWLALALS